MDHFIFLRGEGGWTNRKKNSCTAKVEKEFKHSESKKRTVWNNNFSTTSRRPEKKKNAAQKNCIALAKKYNGPTLKSSNPGTFPGMECAFPTGMVLSRFDLETGIDFDNCGLKFGIVFMPTTIA